MSNKTMVRGYYVTSPEFDDNVANPQAYHDSERERIADDLARLVKQKILDSFETSEGRMGNLYHTVEMYILTPAELDNAIRGL